MEVFCGECAAFCNVNITHLLHLGYVMQYIVLCAIYSYMCNIYDADFG